MRECVLYQHAFNPARPVEPSSAAAQPTARLLALDRQAVPSRRLSLLFNLSACRFVGLGVGSLDGFADVVAGGGPAVLRSGRAAGTGPGGFRCAGGDGEHLAEVPVAAADAGGGEAAGLAGLLPGQPDIGGEIAGEAELGVAGDDQPGPAVGGMRVADLGRSSRVSV